MANTNQRKQDEILRTAADWWVRLRAPGAGDETIDQWLAWTGQDERHLEMFERVSELAARIGKLDTVSRQSLVKAFGRPAEPSRRWMPLAAAAGLAAVMLCAAFLAWSWYVAGTASQVYRSAVAQNRDITLPDGTHVALGAASTLTTRFSHGQRKVELSAGEAYFQVVHDNSRPFVVAAGNVSIRDIGTAFDVRRTGEHVTIAVMQGRVQIANTAKAPGAARGSVLDVSAGQRVSYNPATASMSVGSITPEQAIGWRDDRLAFIDEPLSVVIANLNRYSARPLRIADANLGALSYTGTIRADAIDSWLGALPQVFPLRVEARADQVTLSDVKQSPQR